MPLCAEVAHAQFKGSEHAAFLYVGTYALSQPDYGEQALEITARAGGEGIYLYAFDTDAGPAEV